MKARIAAVSNPAKDLYCVTISQVLEDMVMYPHHHIKRADSKVADNGPLMAEVYVTQAGVCKISEVLQEDDYLSISDAIIDVNFSSPHLITLNDTAKPNFKQYPITHKNLTLQVCQECSMSESQVKVTMKSLHGTTYASYWFKDELARLKDSLGMAEDDVFSEESKAFVTLTPDCRIIIAQVPITAKRIEIFE